MGDREGDWFWVAYGDGETADGGAPEKYTLDTDCSLLDITFAN